MHRAYSLGCLLARGFSWHLFHVARKTVCENERLEWFPWRQLLLKEVTRRNLVWKMVEDLFIEFGKVCELFWFGSLNVKRGSIAFCCWKPRRTIFFLDLLTGHGKSVTFQALSIVYSCVDPTRKSQTVVNTTHKTVNRLAHRQLHLNHVVPERRADWIIKI